MKSWRQCNSRCGLIERRRVFYFIFIIIFKNREKKSLKREKKVLKKSG